MKLHAFSLIRISRLFDHDGFRRIQAAEDRPAETRTVLRQITAMLRIVIPAVDLLSERFRETEDRDKPLKIILVQPGCRDFSVVIIRIDDGIREILGEESRIPDPREIVIHLMPAVIFQTDAEPGPVGIDFADLLLTEPGRRMCPVIVRRGRSGTFEIMPVPFVIFESLFQALSP